MTNTNTCWESLQEVREQDSKASCINYDCEYCFKAATGGCGILHLELNRTGEEDGDVAQGTFKTPTGGRIRPEGLSGSQISKLLEQTTASVNIRTNSALDRMWMKLGAYGMASDDAMDILGMCEPVSVKKPVDNHEDAFKRISEAKVQAQKSDLHGNCGKKMSEEAKLKQRKAKGTPFRVIWPDGRTKEYFSTIHASEDPELNVGSRTIYGWLKGYNEPGGGKRSAHLKGCKFEYCDK